MVLFSAVKSFLFRRSKREGLIENDSSFFCKYWVASLTDLHTSKGGAKVVPSPFPHPLRKPKCLPIHFCGERQGVVDIVIKGLMKYRPTTNNLKEFIFLSGLKEAFWSLTLNVQKIHSDVDPELFKECMQKFEEDEAKAKEQKENQEAILRCLKDLTIVKSNTTEMSLAPKSKKGEEGRDSLRTDKQPCSTYS
ncbi:B'ETA: Serine/threonine protein phosphatase 2A 59 kDa regulatory subunit B' eta isoform [Bienertia sinuspersici]